MTAVLENPTARVKWLAAPSSASWLEQANARPELVLIDPDVTLTEEQKRFKWVAVQV